MVLETRIQILRKKPRQIECTCKPELPPSTRHSPATSVEKLTSPVEFPSKSTFVIPSHDDDDL